MNAASKTACTELLISSHDNVDALRIINAAVAIVAIPGFVSSAAREMAVTRLREMSSAHPGNGELWYQIISHIEGHR